MSRLTIGALQTHDSSVSQASHIVLAGTSTIPPFKVLHIYVKPLTIEKFA
jgi:hypothetical protein